MLKSDILWPTHKQYKSKTEWEPLGFFSECLCNSQRFDLMLGFFSSSAIRTLSDGFAAFLYNGGNMRLIINNILSSQDKDAVISGLNNKIIPFDIFDIVSLKKTLSENDKHFFECLSWLISNKRIDIKVIAPKGTIGISHTKSGVFYDGINSVGFNGSCNFTKTALLDNIESIDAFCDWDGNTDVAKVKNTLFSFEKTFYQKDDSVQYLDPQDIITNITNNFENKSIQDLLKQENELNQNKDNTDIRLSIRKALAKAKLYLNKTIEKDKIEKSKPHFPYPSGPRKYQEDAYEKWCKNDKQGIFAMATGTGKTITSLNCLLQEYKETGVYRAIILVPTISLVEQWVTECEKFNFTENIIKVSSKNKWQEILGGLATLRLIGEDYSSIIITTYASFVLPRFQKEFIKLSKDTLFIADEAHNIGSPGILRKLNHINLIKRIGLSATPERQYQDEINDKIKLFFNEKGVEYTYSYTMDQAIHVEPKALCPYRYYPKLVKLTTDEFKEYVEYTRKITHMNPKTKEEYEIFQILCLSRQRIVHRAENKIAAFCEILQKEFTIRGNLKYTLIYTPEGLDNNDLAFDASKNDSIAEYESDRNLLNKYTKAVSDINSKITVKQFTGQTPSDERTQILRNFSNGKLEVITSMKCLDEGIDVPRSELAVFCSSTGNPRQFIQRRGRVLRLHPDKLQAVIYDLVVIPEPSEDSTLFCIEKNEVEKELRRIRDFALMSENEYESLSILEETLNYYHLTL
jgi:superfamily II DNA or RNA helicase